ncbi:dynein assembly factor 4, axonemal-like [Folsomia candida]|uniref:dynein assembly factor 4, axonemal-like n=1 Tax=Folsomia candida TaxID=158441 RepID=UPI0016055A0A|nr:dynein assembly factor 4, axonemal-like [Folsomia candida]
MPLIVKKFSWHQTPSSISIVVPIPGILPSKTDVLTSSKYIRIHCHPHIFEAFLWGTVDDEKGSCTIDQAKSTVFLHFPKTCSIPDKGSNNGEDKHSDDDTAAWPSLEAQGLDRLRKKVLRDAAVCAAHQRHIQEEQTAETRREELKKTSVLVQIRMDEEARAKVAETKKIEADKALADMNRWAAEGGLLPGETISDVILPQGRNYGQVANKQTGAIATGERLDRNRPAPRTSNNKSRNKETLEELIAQGPSSVSILSADADDQDALVGLVGGGRRKQKFGGAEGRNCPASLTTSVISPSSRIWPELGDKPVSGGGGGGGDGYPVSIRQPQRITVAFTPREFPTPARESSAPLEEEWLKKQAEARHLSGFNEPDLRPEERDPDWLLQKGRSLMKADCHLGAVSAFSLGIKLAPKIPQLYSERAKAHLHLRNFMKVVDDSSVALELFTPKVSANAIDRLKCHVTRADGFQALEMYTESLLDLKEALRLSPDDEKLKQRFSQVSALLDEALVNSDLD